MSLSILVSVGVVVYLLLGVTSATYLNLAANERQLDFHLLVAGESERADRRYSVRATIPIDIETELFVHSNVQAVTPLMRTRQRLQLEVLNAPNGASRLFVTGVSLSPYEISLPRPLVGAGRDQLARPGSLILSERDKDRTGFALGDVIETDRGMVKIAGIAGGPMARSSSYVSLQTLQLLGGASSAVTPSHYRALLIRLEDPSLVSVTQDQMKQRLEPLGLVVLTLEETINEATFQALRDNPMLRDLMIAAAVGAFIALLIVTQTLRAAILSQREQFAALRALGVSRWRLSAVALEMAFWTGLLGVVFAWSFSVLAQAGLSSAGVDMAMSRDIVVLVSINIFALSMIGGLAALPSVLGVAPSELLR